MKLFIMIYSLLTDELVERIALDPIFTESELMDILNIKEDGIFDCYVIPIEVHQRFISINLAFDFTKYEYQVQGFDDE